MYVDSTLSRVRQELVGSNASKFSEFATRCGLKQSYCYNSLELFRNSFRLGFLRTRTNLLNKSSKSEMNVFHGSFNQKQVV